MDVALLGPRGTYTHEAAETFFTSYEPEFCQTLVDVFEADTDAAIFAFENSLEGSVSNAIDLLRQTERSITGEYKHPINHCLLAEHDDITAIKRVRSHPQALGQCQAIIREYGWEQIESPSTAQAIHNLESNEAAIASELAGTLNEMHILRTGIADSETNVTRFLILDHAPTEGEKTAMILDPGEDRPGLLHSMLGCFSGHDINLSYIQSRPTKTKLGKYYFFVEAEIGRDSPRFQRALQCLETYTDVNILGSYPKATPK
ncbi:MAG: prephenate dehydratase [Halobacteriaceae archaeon]